MTDIYYNTVAPSCYIFKRSLLMRIFEHCSANLMEISFDALGKIPDLDVLLLANLPRSSISPLK